ncbi:glutamate racemase [Streptomonospora wellingtoniae]|uniref:Aspartate/glutamate racemase family protein n=1 Tax=Streptomonospora wellingtoniae TaxID=3075544 RepID=A0ABU2KZK4_9ACTN|nr:aspartate/glutamate racemase family protein [Streptomonospora sp. DSM 45055]MDT0304731.1 aspartate/glutamate racemase family protein [Streptomonospora sp. DSM 45055]
MRIAFVDSGIGMLSTAAAVRAARPDADLVLSMDPDHMPWGARAPEAIVERVLAGARAALGAGGRGEARTGTGAPSPTGAVAPDAIVVPCNTASVHGLTSLREAFEPHTPVVGTVPPIKPAAARGGPVAVWSTVATSRSRYQQSLIEEFGQGVEVVPVPCPGLAEAIESAAPRAIDAAIAHAVARTPPQTTAVVLGCTHYDLVEQRISDALGGRAEMFTAAGAVAAQTLRRLGIAAAPELPLTGGVAVLASGRPTRLPAAALAYRSGAALTRVPQT